MLWGGKRVIYLPGPPTLFKDDDGMQEDEMKIGFFFFGLLSSSQTGNTARVYVYPSTRTQVKAFPCRDVSVHMVGKAYR